MALMTGSDTDLRVTALGATGVRLNHRQRRLFGDRYVRAFQLWFRFRVFYCNLFAFYLRDRHFLLYDTFFFFSCLHYSRFLRFDVLLISFSFTGQL